MRLWAAARPRAVRAASFARRVDSLSGQAPPLLSNFARNSPASTSNIEFMSLELQRFQAIFKSDRGKLCAKCVWGGCVGSLSGQAPPPPTGTAARPRCHPRHSNFACNSPAACSNIEFASLELQRFLGLLKFGPIELHAKFVWRWSCHHPRVSRPPFGTAAWPSGSSGTLHACGAGVLLCRLARYLPRVRYKILPTRPLGGENGTKLSLHAEKAPN